MSPPNGSPESENAKQDAVDKALAGEDLVDNSANGDLLASGLDGPGADSTEEALRAELRGAEKRVLQAQAELENFRKRMRREMDEDRKYAALPLISDLLSVVDNLDRGIESVQSTESSPGLLDGVKMVASQLRSLLQKYDCREIEAAGADFDPHFHEAIAQQPSDDVAAGKVMLVATPGYQLHERVVRPSQVLVSTGPAAPTDSSATEDAADPTNKTSDH